MKIGIIGAIEQEIRKIKEIINNLKIKKIGNIKIYTGTFKKIEIFLILSGIGKVSASMSTTISINLFQPDFIINSGSAGSLNACLKIGDIIIPKKTCYYDVDLTNFGYSKGQIPEYPQTFKTNKNLREILKEIAVEFKFKFLTGLLVTGDSFIRKSNCIKKIKNQFSSAIGVDMESTAIGQVCHNFKIPFIIIKSISDLSDNNATSHFEKNIPIASLKSSKLVKLLLKKISSQNSI
ncbi:5'-methylthioadenosine/adenosylhomocysteine nucleosidase [Buchnera aphidicola]|jgi:adenosylhomocysteine nucleosidase|uniref:5'-methylthioadenosine/S-adenosylhomocysteine nucleosidase n=1 Tax=Buchnera aphidicola subsp. Schizaphis graminum (strain Sg) TaxID=198804 RepID=MTNN_BUCAP|nr:5'-methylthioadenosine/adenosylhomocysteine nucleosidase [Buchnera aphidicola]O51931.1 RecName: Full=5'-methylthioadenosine/S-adenosylhomocysteine nucleosidase; Short=MTA/SAH nucleosidase; Short=MTAN; AltName: Full=5'-deoxyadenosine nucleosidase; Short=DOA nucleosidase; Short=dAdo nucleosidase; AltName: Full=5'-methylthioadenosine nucleosidase; Short=MTA nucleosidase; AltName: Full=S-adenosylhomocysteine nucleosidase; Short=AdoHcy nucleosidase; Short=SAH nucleosidase; Short=SRH nucleosidase [Bu